MSARSVVPSLLALLALAAAACQGRPKTTPAPAATDPAHQPRTGPSLAILDLTQGAPEEPQSPLFSVAPRKQSFAELAFEIDKLAADKNVKATLVRFGDAALGYGRAMELGDALEALKAKKPVYCHADGYSNATLYASARGCTKVYVSPAGEVEGVGLAIQLIYGHKLLAEYLNVSIDTLQVGRFKGAEEPLTRDGPSPEARASLEGTLSDMRETWLDGIKRGRPDAPEGAAEDGPYSPEAAKQAKLVDEIGYFDEAKAAAKQASGAVRDDVRFGPGATPGKGDDLGDVLRAIAGEGVGAAPVALVRATGEISMAGGGGVLGRSTGITEHDLSRTLAKVERDDDIKALVLRIDSPGGSALASDLLWHDLMRIRQKKPIVVSVGEMAASGGYYLASTGSVIFADDASIVGSIGVVYIKIAIGNALEKIGVHVETVPAKTGDAKAAARATYGSLLSAWDDTTREKLRDTATGVYSLFLKRVVEGRGGKLTLERLEDSAEGRIFSGREGKENGLVDEIGGLMASIAKARELAGLAPDARVAILGQRGGFLEALGGGDEEASAEGRAAAVAQAAAEGARPLALLEETMPEAAPFVASFAPALRGEHTLAAMPFAIVVR